MTLDSETLAILKQKRDLINLRLDDIAKYRQGLADRRQALQDARDKINDILSEVTTGDAAIKAFAEVVGTMQL
jgi:hypothetical protein